jgi:molecular chaperone GrpE
MSNKARATRCDVILELLPVLDDLERALKAVPEGDKEQSWAQGVAMVERKFKAILESQGVCAVEALGQPFDPNYHEAMRREKGEEGVILEEYRKGYKMQDKLLRPAQVVVGTGEEDTEDTKEEEE